MLCMCVCLRCLVLNCEALSMGTYYWCWRRPGLTRSPAAGVDSRLLWERCQAPRHEYSKEILVAQRTQLRWRWPDLEDRFPCESDLRYGETGLRIPYSGKPMTRKGAGKSKDQGGRARNPRAQSRREPRRMYNYGNLGHPPLHL